MSSLIPIHLYFMSFGNGSVATRSCDVPAWKDVLILVMQVEYSEKETPNASMEDLRRTVTKDLVLTVSILK